jgi:sugar phosphate isomerase/epimerase
MLIPGLVSVTFRNLSPSEIVKLVSKARLSAIEWGGDIHVPHGELETAIAVRKMTLDAGLKIAAYGSYYKVGCEDPNLDIFKNVLETAVLLNAPTIRVWAGTKGSSESDSDWRKNVVEMSHNIAETAKDTNIKISFEFHGNTLTDTNKSASDFYKEVNHPNVRAYWQPAENMNFGERFTGLKMLSSILSNIHVFQWTKDKDNNTIMHPLQSGFEDWEKYIGYASELEDTHYAMLEFVRDNNANQFLADAKTLIELLK